MNKLKIERQTAAIHALVEGNSMRSTERMTGIHRDTITRLMVQVGAGCNSILDEKMRKLCRARGKSQADMLIEWIEREMGADDVCSL